MSAASRIAVAVTGALATVLVARLLGPSGTGRYAIAQTLVVMLMLATTLGVEHGIAYYVSSGRWDAADAHRAAQRVAFVSGLLGAAAGMAARMAIPEAFGGLSLTLTAVTVLALPFALSWLYLTYVALAIDRYELYAAPPAAQSLLALVLVAVLAAVFGITGAICGLTLAHAATSIAFLWRTRQSLDRADEPEIPTADQSRGGLRRAIRFGIKGYAANALQFINYRLDLFILAAVGTASDVGHYAIAVAATSVMWLLPQALSDVLFPRIASLSTSADPSRADMRLFVETKSLRHTTLAVTLSATAVAGALLFLVVPVYGGAFHPAVRLGLILLPGVALIGLAGTLSAIIVGRGQPGYSLLIALIVTPATIVLYATLIPLWGASGAALASTASYTLSFVLAVIFYRRSTGRPLGRRLIPTLSEWADYRVLGPSIRAWASQALARRSHLT